MYRVVLVDDENIIVQGLQKVIDWESKGCSVVATASDARQGAEAIRTHQPHILITDINMPREDGLTMVAGLRGEFPDMQITILTGHRDFEYARRALSLGVTRYLLKPSKMDELEEALTVMLANLGSLQEADDSEGTDAANSFIARQAQSFIAEHYAEKFTLKEVADHCYVSQWHLSKLLSKHLGQNFYDLLNSERIKRAKELLADPALRISQIAEQVGYADTAHFSRVFKKCEGISANEYRNKML